MNKLHKILLINTAVLLAAISFLSLIPGKVAADEVIVYPYSASYIRQGIPNNNYGAENWLYIVDYSTDKQRTVIRVPNQSGGGTVVDVQLKLWYDWYNQSNPSGRTVRIYRLTKSFDESYVSWLKRSATASWTTAGGDYTTTDYATVNMPGTTHQWITWNITTMANYAWGLGQDLYILVMYRYETKSAETMSRIAFGSDDNPDPGLRPKVIVTFEEEEQIPEVDGVIDSYGDDWVKFEISPKLYGWETATVYAQCSLHNANNWIYESAGQIVTNGNPVIETVFGLTKNTQYDVRAKLVYGESLAVYGVPDTFTTMPYNVPVFNAGYSGLGVNSVTLHASWTENTDYAEMDIRIGYKKAIVGEWTYTSWQTSYAVSGSKNWLIENLYDNTPYSYKAQFDIDGYVYETGILSFTTNETVDIHASVADHGINFVQLKVDYDCQGADQADIYTRIRKDGESYWTYSPKEIGKTGSGTLYFTFDNLSASCKYWYCAIAEIEGGTSSACGTDYWFWTEDIEVQPTINNLNAQFIAPNTIRLKVNITLGDVAAYGPKLYFALKDYSIVMPYWFTGTKAVAADGECYIDLICGDVLDWHQGYDFYGVLDYTVGSIQTDPDWFNTPYEPFWVGTLNPTGLSGTSVILRGQIQLGDVESTTVKFYYWVMGTSEKISTPEVVISSSGVFTWQVDGLLYGTLYNYQAWASFGQTYGNVVSFRAGFLDKPDPPVDPGWPNIPGLPNLGGIINWFASSTAGHWLILLLAMGVSALIFYRKHRSVALILCLVILGIGIVVGWVDPWIIILLGIGAGLIIWRMVAGSRGPA